MTSVTPSPSIPFSSLTSLGCLSASALLLALILNNLTRGKMYQCKLCNTVCWDHIYSIFCSRNRELTDVEAHTSVIAHCLLSILPTLYLMEKIWKKNVFHLTLSVFLSKHLVCAFVGPSAVSHQVYFFLPGKNVFPPVFSVRKRRTFGTCQSVA